MTVPMFRAVDQHGKSGAAAVLDACQRIDDERAEFLDAVEARAALAVRVQELEAELSEQFHRADRLESKLQALRAAHSLELKNLRLDLADARKERRGW